MEKSDMIPSVKNRRRKYFVDPIQLRLFLLSLSLFCAGAFAIWWEVRGDLLNLQSLVKDNYQDPTLHHFITNYAEITTQGIMLKSILVIVILAMAGVLVLHHIFGPLYRLKACMKSMGEGDFSTRMKLRNHDYLMDVQDGFNSMAESIEKRVK